MRTLTPGERREIEAIKAALVRQRAYLYGNGAEAEPVTISVQSDRNEMWRTVLDLALQANEAIEKRWNSYEAERVKPVAEIAAAL